MPRYIDADALVKRLKHSPLFLGTNMQFKDGVIDLVERQPAADAVPRAEVAREVLVILYKELVYYHENIKNEYMKLPSRSTNTARFRGASATVDYICNMILKLEKQYTEDGE